MGQLGDAELTRIAMGSRQADVTSAPQFPKLRSKCRDGCSDSDVVANRAFPMLRPRVTLRCILNRSLILMTSGASLPTQRSSNSLKTATKMRRALKRRPHGRRKRLPTGGPQRSHQQHCRAVTKMPSPVQRTQIKPVTIELQAPLRAVVRDGRQRFRPRFIDRRAGFGRFMATDRSTALM
jgi:hypothetical protein